MNQLLAPVSVGELYDKISILEIKLIHVGDNQQKRDNIVKELNLLRSIETTLDKTNINDVVFQSLYDKLKEVNLFIWNIEDEIRKYEKVKNFGEQFIYCARQVYIKNDLRAVIKKDINNLMNSQITEEKIY